MRTLFGTDGIRGRANVYPITCEIALKTGEAAGMLARQTGCEAVIIGKDTRISGDMLESALAAGIASVGVDVYLAGVIPTPGVAFLAASMDKAGAGIVISASHNPYYDNGIKIFSQGGTKLSDDQETFIESHILDPKDVPREHMGKISTISDGLNRYAHFLMEKFVFMKPEFHHNQTRESTPIKVIIDGANGAAAHLSHLVFFPPIFDATFIHDTPDGVNINDNCGSQHTRELAQMVLSEKADIGLAFDGDADRLIAIDEKGNEITGDRILAICARYAKTKNQLKRNIVVSTIMSNVGLRKTLEHLDISHVISDVGDRKVLEEMNRTGAVIGGEDSGHLLFLEDHTTGDGMLTALKLLEVMKDTGQSLSALASIMKVYPQVLMNVIVDASRPDFTRIEPIVKAIREVEEQLADKGRVLIRYSGTQPLLRVMVEGPDKHETQAACQHLCDVIRENM